MNVKNITLEQLNSVIKTNNEQPMKRRALLIVRSALKDKGCNMEEISHDSVERIISIRRKAEEAASNACMDTGDEVLFNTFVELDEALGQIPTLLFTQ